MRHKKGFTLVELLVVIGIISVLIAMLLPALNKARQAATKVACASRMRQLGMIFEMYTVNNHGMYPALINYNTSPWSYTNQVSYSYGRSDGSIGKGLLMPSKEYVGYNAAVPPNAANSLYRCPAQGSEQVGTYWYYGYAYNYYIGSNYSGHELRKTNHRHPTETMLLIESDSSGDSGTRPYYATAASVYGVSTGFASGYTFAAVRHGGSGTIPNIGGMNIAYLDGHVAWWPNINTLPTDPYDVFWSRNIDRVLR
jgi:prepilin-type N-terminal cleavage/methylation domain-containing protein/prepilin-type processing-associated H-X9-DG protein